MLVDSGGGFVVNDSKELYRTLRNLLEDDLARSTAGGRASRFVQANLGATGRFLHHLERHPGGGNPEPSHRNETLGRQ